MLEPNVWDVIDFRWWGTWIVDWEYRLDVAGHNPFADLGCYSNFTEIWGAEVCFWVEGSVLDENDDYGLQDYLWSEGVLPGWIADYDIYNIRCQGENDLPGCPKDGRCVGRLLSPVSETEWKLMNRD